MRGSAVGVLVATLGMTTPALTACNAISPDLLGDIGAGVTASGSPILVVAACDQTVTGLTFTSGDPPANEDWVSEAGRRGTFDVALEDSAGWDVRPGGGDVLPDEGEVLVAADFVGQTDDSGMGFIFYETSSFAMFRPGYVYRNSDVTGDGSRRFERMSREVFTQEACGLSRRE